MDSKHRLAVRFTHRTKHALKFMKSKFIYAPEYDFSLFGIEKLHPFDGKKYSKAWQMLSNEIGTELNNAWIRPRSPISDEELLIVHQQQYLSSLSSSKIIAQILEISAAKFLPSSILQKRFVNPARCAVTGTVEATKAAISGNCMAMNVGGGFHHAFPDHGEGFSFFADAALSIVCCRKEKILSKEDNIVMIDLDAHRGNGFEYIFANDASVHMFDMYNFQVYPGLHNGDPDEFPFIIPLKAKCNTDRYLNTLTNELPKFLSSVSSPKLAFYNAGTDILSNDPLGGLNVEYSGVVERDKYVLDELAKRNIPTVIMTSGGYTKQSFELIAQMATQVFLLGK